MRLTGLLSPGGVVALAAVLLAGCAYGVADLQREHVERRATVPGHHAKLATCAVRAFEEAPSGGFLAFSPGDYRWLLHRDAELIRAIGHMERPQLEVAFAQRRDAVLIETRVRRSASGPRVVEAKVWPLIERCAGQKVAVEPPIR